LISIMGKKNVSKTTTKSKKPKSKSKKVVAGKTVTKSASDSKVASPPKTPVVAATTKTDLVASPTLGDSFAALLGQLQALRSQLTSVTSQVRTLQKRSERELKNALKASKKQKRKNGNRAPSGFVKPTKISKELANFLGKPLGTEMARTEVTREINTYIRAHKLQDPSNGRVIRADTKLRKLLKLGKGDELTYFNLQRYMSPHFAKSIKKIAAEKAAAAAAAVATSS
jgi:chromatin remodeling complex protein RSC6